MVFINNVCVSKKTRYRLCALLLFITLHDSRDFHSYTDSNYYKYDLNLHSSFNIANETRSNYLIKGSQKIVFSTPPYIIVDSYQSHNV